MIPWKQRVIKDHYEQICNSKFDKVEEMNKFLEINAYQNGIMKK